MHETAPGIPRCSIQNKRNGEYKMNFATKDKVMLEKVINGRKVTLYKAGRFYYARNVDAETGEGDSGMMTTYSKAVLTFNRHITDLMHR
jgi:hypothetical protein